MGVVSLAAWLAVQALSPRRQFEWTVEMRNAAEKMEEALSVIRTERADLISDFDLNVTGLIGPEYADLFTSLGDLEAKRTTTNPDMAALLVHLDFPINKKLSSPSFILLTSGISAVFLSVFYWLIDVRKYRKWAFFLVVVGVNPIIIYMTSALVSFGSIARVFVGGFDFGNAQPLVFAVTVAAIEWLFLYYLYKQRVFLKI